MTRADATKRALAALAICMLAGMHTAAAAAQRLDDSSSPRARITADFANARSTDGRTLLVPLGRVDYRLATGAYVGRRARIFYVVPLAIAGLRTPSALQVLWRSNGAFASGAARGGERVAVWSGTVAAAWMSEGFDLTLAIDPNALRLPSGSALSFESYFEIETFP